MRPQRDRVRHGRAYYRPTSVKLQRLFRRAIRDRILVFPLPWPAAFPGQEVAPQPPSQALQESPLAQRPPGPFVPAEQLANPRATVAVTLVTRTQVLPPRASPPGSSLTQPLPFRPPPPPTRHMTSPTRIRPVIRP